MLVTENRDEQSCSGFYKVTSEFGSHPCPSHAHPVSLSSPGHRTNNVTHKEKEEKKGLVQQDRALDRWRSLIRSLIPDVPRHAGPRPVRRGTSRRPHRPGHKDTTKVPCPVTTEISGGPTTHVTNFLKLNMVNGNTQYRNHKKQQRLSLSEERVDFNFKTSSLYSIFSCSRGYIGLSPYSTART